MLLKRYFSAVCIGLACFVQPVGVAKSTQRDNLVAIALTPRQIEAKAARFVVKIDGQVKNEEKDEIEEASGTGFIVNKNGNTYTVLTAAHVANNSIGTRTITTPDGKSHSFTAGNVRVLSSKIDLAEITFVSNEVYNVATLSVKTTVSRDSRVQCYGWNAVSKAYRVRGIRSPTGIIEQILPVESSSDGYSLVFNLTTVPGLSGSPLLDENGDVIGVYGLSDGYTSTLGISIATYRQYANVTRVLPIVPSLTSKVTNPQPINQPVNTGFRLAYSLPIQGDGRFSLTISPDGKNLFSGDRDSIIRVWRLTDGKLLHTLRENKNSGTISSLAISLDGQTLTSVSEYGTVSFWRWTEEKLLSTFVPSETVRFPITVSPDGRRFVSGNVDGTINVRRVDGKLLYTLLNKGNSIVPLALSPDEQILLSGSGQTIRIWRLSDGQPLHTFTGHIDWITSLNISSDGQIIVSGSKDKTIKIWRLNDGQLLDTLSNHQEEIRAVAISPNKQIIVSASKDNTMKVWRSSP